MQRHRTVAAMFFLALAGFWLMAAGNALWAATSVPSGPRSRAAIKRADPALRAEAGKKGLALGSPVFMRIFKDEGVFEIWLKKGGAYSLFKACNICTFSGEPGPKLKKGDGQAPEGFYEFRPPAMNPHSQFHLSFDLGYPNRYDRFHGRTGSALMVHGNCVSIGCYAMTDEGIEEIWTIADAAFRNGQEMIPVHIFPFRPTNANLEKRRESRWLDFWQNLKEGFDLFEKNRVPPRVSVSSGRYVFGNDK